MNKPGNQIKAKMIQSYPKTDREKLAEIEKLVHRKYPEVPITLEPYMSFKKGEDSYIGIKPDMSETWVRKYTVHPPDAVLYVGSKMVVFELDGPIHDVKVSKTNKRNRRYELNNIDYFVINETELKGKLKIPKSRPLTQDQINDEFMLKFKKFL